MITEAGLAVYRSFNGDGDGFARVGTAAQKALLPEKEWGLVESFLQDLHLVQQGLVSSEYAAGVQHRLARHCGSSQVIASLEAMAQAKKPERFIPRVMAKVRTWLRKYPIRSAQPQAKSALLMVFGCRSVKRYWRELRPVQIKERFPICLATPM